MNIRMFFLGDTHCVSRKEKKTIKGQVNDCIAKIYQEKKPIEKLYKIPLEQNGSIYSEKYITKAEIDNLFPKKVDKQTNYLIGAMVINTKNVMYLINVDELFFMSGTYFIWPSDEKKSVSIKLLTN